jgi:hypothetical protein
MEEPFVPLDLPKYAHPFQFPGEFRLCVVPFYHFYFLYMCSNTREMFAPSSTAAGSKHATSWAVQPLWMLNEHV